MLTAQSLDIKRSGGDVAGSFQCWRVGKEQIVRLCFFASICRTSAAEMLKSERLGRIQMETVLSPERTPSQTVGVV
jgi:hypothetical protein